MKKAILVLIQMTLLFSGSGQYLNGLSFNHINENQGLANKKIWGIFKDSHQFMWFSTSNGLFRFDGNQCKAYFAKPTDTNALASKFTFNIVEDKQQNLWIGTGENLHRYNRLQDNFTRFSFPIFEGEKWMTKSFTLPFYLDNENKLWIFFGVGSKVGAIDLNSKNFTFKKYGNFVRYICQPFPSKPFQPLQQIFSDQQKGFFQYDIKKDTCTVLEYLKNEKPAIDANRFLITDSVVWMTSTLGLVKWDKQTKKHQLFNTFGAKKLSNLTDIKEDKWGRFWIGSKQAGLFVFDPKKLTFIQQYTHENNSNLTLAGNQIDRILIDSQQTIFVSVYGEGVDFAQLTSPKFPSMYETEMDNFAHQKFSFTNFVQSKNGNIFASTAQDGILELDAQKKIIARYNTQNAKLPDNKISAIFLDKNNILWIGTSKGIVLGNLQNHTFSLLKNTLPDPLFFEKNKITSIGTLQDGTLLFSTSNGIYKIENQTKYTDFEMLNQQEYRDYASFFQLKNGTLLVNASGSYFNVLKKEKNKWVLKKPLETISSVFAYYEQNDSLLWFTGNSGLFKMNTQSWTYEIILLSNQPSLYGLIVAADNTFWMSSDKGIYQYNPANKSTKFFSFGEGVLQNYFQETAFSKLDNGEILFGGKAGMNAFFPANITPSSILPTIEITNLKINDLNSQLKNYIGEVSHLEFGYLDNTLSFEFGAINYTNPINNLLQYKLEGYDKNWVNCTGSRGFARYAQLPAGSYIFSVRAANSDGIFNPKIKQISIQINPPFYKTWWFKLLALLTLVGIVFLYIRLRIAQVKKEESQKTLFQKTVSELESKALRAQMNPHFIFNALNSIQRYIYENNKEKSAKYLSMFARLMRLILENSKHQLIPLRDELESLTHYVSLEQMRFSSQFEFKISTHPDLEVDYILIPPLILQPFAENAIWHGLMNKEGECILKMEVFEKEEMLHCVIEDNGVGRAQAAIQKSKLNTKHESTAMKVTEERLSFLNEKKIKKATIKYIDLFHEDGSAAGTRVEVVMPILEKK